MKKIRILIVDDHDLIHKGLKDILSPVDRFQVVGNAYNGNEAIEKAKLHHPDVILMDISMPEKNGIEATSVIKRMFPEIKIIAMTQHEEKEYVMQFLKSGGHGYLLKNSTKNEFIQSIETILEDKIAFSPEVASIMMKDMVHTKSNPIIIEDEIPLTKREIEIIKKIANDMSNQEIADELHISLRTVETHRRNLMQKLNVKSVVALLKLAATRKIITFE